MVPKPLRVLLRPEALLVAAAVVLASWNRLEHSAAEFVRAAPYAVGLAGLAIAWPLRRSRLLFSLVILGLAYLVIARLLPRNQHAFHLLALLVPLNLAAVALLPERGATSRPGLWHWCALLVQTAAAALLLKLGRGLPWALLQRPFLPAGLTAWTAVGQVPLLAFALAATLLALGRIFAPTATATGYLWSLGSTFLAFHAKDVALDRPLYFATAAGVLAIAAIELSYLLAYHDGLTNLPGRRALNEALARVGGGYVVAMVDVDHFKRFNDTYGHDVGDEVLRSVAARLVQTLPDASVFRYGGEEFTVLFKGWTKDECIRWLERAREAVARQPFTVRRRLRPRKKPARPRSHGRRNQETITVSIGVAERDRKHETAASVIRAADQALYRAKEGGRNRVRT